MTKKHSSVAMRSCTLDEYESLLAFLDTQFRKKPGRWFARYKPQIFQPTAASVRHHRIVTDSKGIAGCIGIYPMKIRVGKAVLTVGGVGSVSSRGDLRGCGLMSAMLRDTVHTLEKQAYDISWLGGNRFRYGNYGWENGGHRLQFQVALVDLPRRYPGIKPFSPRKATARDIDTLARLYRRIPTGIVRPRDVWPIHLRNEGYTFVIAGSGRDCAYLVHHRADPEAIVEVSGRPETVAAMLLGHGRKHKRTWLRVSLPDISTPLTEKFFEMCAGFHLAHQNQYRVVDVASCWDKLVPEMVSWGESHGVKGASRQLAAVTRTADRRVVLARALGFSARVPALPARLKKLEWVAPLGWWMSDVDGV